MGTRGLDVAGPLKRTRLVNDYFIIRVDYFSKFCVGRATADFPAETKANFVRNDVISKLGVPPAILSDQGRNFKSKFFYRIHSSTGFAPKEIIFGKLLESLVDRKLGIDSKKYQTDKSELINQKLNASRDQQKKFFDSKIKITDEFRVGDLITLINSRHTKGQIRSFEPKYLGLLKTMTKSC